MKNVFLTPALALLCALPLGCKEPPPTPLPPTPHELAVPEHGAYTGAYVDLGDTEDDLTLEKVEKFESLTGKHLALIACSSYWGEQSFPTRQLAIVAAHDSVPIVYWSPWDKPYEQDHAPDRFSLTNILKGNWDAYIDKWADSAKAYGRPMLVAWGLEMNGTWFPWSGCFYGGGNVVPGKKNSWEGPETYKAAYRHVVDRVRARGAENIRWVFHANNYPYPSEVWNVATAYYPGDNYVDWLGLSVYGKQFARDDWAEFQGLLDFPYAELCNISPDKPILIAEWGIGEFPNAGDKGRWISEAMRLMSTRYPRLKGAVFWHERWENEDGTYSNLRVNSSPGSLDAYRKGVADPFWLGSPQFK